MRETLQLGHRLVSSRIKSIQRGTILVTGAQTNTATIAAVDTAHALIYWAGHRLDTNNGNTAWMTVALTNATTVTASRGSAGGAETNVVSFVVVEFYPGVIKSVQRSTVTIPVSTANNQTATITAVDLLKAQLNFLGSRTLSATFSGASQSPTVVLTNATTVTAQVGVVAALNDVVAGFQVVEWV